MLIDLKNADLNEQDAYLGALDLKTEAINIYFFHSSN